MKVSRRMFLGTAGSAAALVSLRATKSHASGLRSQLEQLGLDCVVIDLCSHCALRESVDGYRLALGSDHDYFPAAMPPPSRRWRTAIVPGLASIGPDTVRMLSDLLHAGTHVLLETGAGFLSAPQFASHQKMLWDYFGVAVGGVVDPWAQISADDVPSPQGFGQRSVRARNRQPATPYVRYVWPHKSMVRDFSRFIAVRAQAGEVIASVGEVPVALKKRVGKGTLIFLGSPLGPLLRAGDLEARSWLESVTAL